MEKLLFKYLLGLLTVISCISGAVFSVALIILVLTAFQGGTVFGYSFYTTIISGPIFLTFGTFLVLAKAAWLYLKNNSKIG